MKTRLKEAILIVTVAFASLFTLSSFSNTNTDTQDSRANSHFINANAGIKCVGWTSICIIKSGDDWGGSLGHAETTTQQRAL